MNCFRFDSGCFHSRWSEQMIILTIASKGEYNNFHKFIEDSIKFDVGTPVPEQILKRVINRSSTEQEIKNLSEILTYMKWVEIRTEDINKAFTVFEPEWNDMSFAFETQFNYYYLAWSTSA